MAWEVTFEDMTTAQRTQAIELTQKIAAIEEEIAKISDARANAEANWRKKENFLNTKKGELQIALRQLRTAILKEIA